VIEETAGPAVTIIDPAAAVIRQLHRRLAELGLVAISAQQGEVTFMTSSDPVAMSRVLAVLGETQAKVLPLQDT
jgi:glutamate racemase